jgi:hypothetical protein
MNTTELAVEARNRLLPLLHSVQMQAYCPKQHQIIQELLVRLLEIYLAENKRPAKQPDIKTESGYVIPGLRLGPQSIKRRPPPCCD